MQVWPSRDRREVYRNRMMRVDAEQVQNPRNNEEFEFYRMNFPNWANVVAETVTGKFVFIRQYRHGIEEIVTEIPGGVIDADDSDPVSAALRELLEETGYAAESAELLGVSRPNLALQNNRCFHILAKGCHRVAAQVLDAGEDIEVFELSREQVKEALHKGEICGSLCFAALGLAGVLS